MVVVVVMVMVIMMIITFMMMMMTMTMMRDYELVGRAGIHQWVGRRLSAPPV